MDVWLFPIGMAAMLAIFGLMSYDQHRKIRKEKARADEWAEVAMRAHTTSKDLLGKIKSYSLAMRDLSLADQHAVALAIHDANQREVQHIGAEIAVMRMQDMQRGYTLVELVDIEDGGVGEGYDAG
jgi:hypothetical protein